MIQKSFARLTPGLVEDVSDVCLALAEPHGQQLRTLDRDEVCLAFIGDGFGQQRFAWNWNGWGETKKVNLFSEYNERGQGVKPLPRARSYALFSRQRRLANYK
jgi:hypothetical protein